MNFATKQCQNCKQPFKIEPEDFGFYEKIKVPPPTFCPECRFQRRLSFCNERHLYKNICGLCARAMISMYPPGTVFPVYCMECYRSDHWNPLAYAAEYDFKKPFFTQFKNLKSRAPRAALVRQGDLTGSEYCNRASYNKNCYLLIRANYNENCQYSYNMWDSRDSADCFNVHKSELTYQSIDSIECYAVQYCQECRLCRNSYFLFDCRNCNNCAGCVGLRNKQYHILNQPYSKEEYESKVKELRLDTPTGLSAFAELFNALAGRAIHEATIKTNCVNSTGNWLNDCKDVKNSYQCRNTENGKNLLSIIEAKDCMDYTYWGRASELIYETSNCGYGCSRIRFVNESWDTCHDLTYCDNCYASSNLFGCVGLKNKEHCILNKQYTKEEYDNLLPKIVTQMSDMPYEDAKGRIYKFGEYFPTELSASPYNITAAQENFPLSEEEIKRQGFSWESFKEKEYQTTKSWRELPDNIKSVDDGFLKEIILCKTWDESHGERSVVERYDCTKAFRLIPAEINFYRRMNIPLPQLCPNCRHYERLMKRTPLKLWHRACMCDKSNHTHQGKCPVEFETSYSPERKEIVYCEQCYNAEVV
jgi:hypothetical protein